jgi:hypothetical protein
MSAAFSPDGKLLATVSSDGTARLWDAPSGAEPLKDLGGLLPRRRETDSGPTRPETEIEKRFKGLSPPPGRREFAAIQDLVDAAKAAVPRCLTREQRVQFGLPPEPPKWCIEMHKWPY